MKFLKILGIIILILVVVLVILGLVAPKKYSVERTVLIDAPRELVFSKVKYWKNFQSWSPWAEKDPTMKITIEGIDGQKGSMYKWVGDPKETGEGEMTNTGVKENEEIAYHLHFIKPWESQSDGYVRVSGVSDGTQATWGFYGETPFPWNIFMLFMSMEKMMSKDFDRGLELLKNICEKEYQTITSYEIKEIIFPARSYAVIEKEVRFNEMKEFFTQSYATIGKAMKQKNMKMIGAPVGLYYTWDEQAMKSQMAAAVPIFGSLQTTEVKTVRLSMSTAYIIDYYGSYEGLMYAHLALDNYLKQKGLKMRSPVIEEYLTDPGTEPDTSKWLTRIYYFAE